MLIDDGLEGLAGSPRFGLEPRGDIIIEGQGSPHVVMLRPEHHGV